MASKLFRAVVGFGIGLGAASAACFGATDGGVAGGAFDDGTDASTSSTSPSGSSSGTTTQVPPTNTTNDAAPDGTVVDAGLDAPKDVGPDAFCEAPWPTTKASPPPPKCIDPNGECAEAGALQITCVVEYPDGGCDTTKAWMGQCVAGEWRCAPGKVEWETCQ